MNPTIKFLRDLGHHKNPLVRESTAGMQATDWNHLDLQSSLGQKLVTSYQMFMWPEHEFQCLRAHSRYPKFDGLVGEATHQLLQMPRCGCPDYQEAATGRGSWGVGCTGEYPNNHAIYYFLDDSKMPAEIRRWWDRVLQIGDGAYEEMGIAFVQTEDKAKSHFVQSFKYLRGRGYIGLASVPRAQDAATCSRGFFLQMDTTYFPSVELVATLLMHERGHICRSGHISGDPTMHPGIRGGWPGSFRGTPFGSRLNDWFGGEPIIPDDPPPANPFDGNRMHIETSGGLYGPFELKQRQSRN